MKLNKRRFLILITITFLAVGLRPYLLGKYITVKSESKFNRALGDYELIIAMFYIQDKAMKKDDPDLYNRIERLERMFKSVSKRREYIEGELHFVNINTAQKKLAELSDVFNIKKMPTFILFKNGVPLRDDKGNIIMLEGFASPSQLNEFIHEHFGDRLEEIKEEKEEARRRRLEELRYRSYYYGPYWGYYGYPYGGYPYYYPYYYHRPGFHFGIGF